MTGRPWRKGPIRHPYSCRPDTPPMGGLHELDGPARCGLSRAWRHFPRSSMSLRQETARTRSQAYSPGATKAARIPNTARGETKDHIVRQYNRRVQVSLLDHRGPFSRFNLFCARCCAGSGNNIPSFCAIASRPTVQSANSCNLRGILQKRGRAITPKRIPIGRPTSGGEVGGVLNIAGRKSQSDVIIVQGKDSVILHIHIPLLPTLRRRILLGVRPLILLWVHPFRLRFFRGSRFQGFARAFNRLDFKARIQAGQKKGEIGREVSRHILTLSRNTLVVRGLRRAHIIFPSLRIVTPGGGTLCGEKTTTGPQMIALGNRAK